MNRFLSITTFATLCLLSTVAQAQFRLPWQFGRTNTCPGGVCNTPVNSSVWNAPRQSSAAWPVSYQQPRSDGYTGTPVYQSCPNGDCQSGNCANGRCAVGNCSTGNCPMPAHPYRDTSPVWSGTAAARTQPAARSSAPRYNDWTPSRLDARRNGSASTPTIPRGMEGLAQLPAGERSAALRQRTCPVTGQLLGSMGRPVRVTVAGRSVYTCCQECAERLRQAPSRYVPMARRPGIGTVR